jgi:hypothetical protein
METINLRGACDMMFVRYSYAYTEVVLYS